MGEEEGDSPRREIRNCLPSAVTSQALGLRSRSVLNSGCGVLARKSGPDSIGNLDRDGSIQAGVLSHVHLANAARTDRPEDLLGTELRWSRETHLFCAATRPRTSSKKFKTSVT
jgi:hypothetical protein